MSDRPVDRGGPLQGLLTTIRDTRQPADSLRAIENYRMPDSRPIRRPGFGFFGDDETQIQGQQLTKQTASAQTGIRINEDIGTAEFEEHEKHPNGYALIRHHADFTPLSTGDWTVEFQLTLGERERLVISPEDRRTRFLYGGIRQPVRAVEGVFVFDQTLMASHCDFDVGGGTLNLRHPIEAAAPAVPAATDIQSTDTLALSSLAIGFNGTELFATCTLITTPGNVYFPYKVNLTHAITYGVGDDYNVAVRYTTSSRLLEFVIDGAAASGGSGAATYTLLAGERFAGEIDAINGQTTAFDRDIVLLNECTVRGAYSSTCKLDHVSNGCSKFTQYKIQKTGPSSTVVGPAVVPYCTPPRGTALSELRIWTEPRTNLELSDNDKLELATPYAASLKGYWRLNDGGGLLIEKVGEKHGTVHNTYPQYVANKNLLHSQGLNFADNQYIQAVLAEEEYVADAYSMMRRCMGGSNPESMNLGLQYESVCDWTFQIQITVPYSSQDELNNTGQTIYPHVIDWNGAAEAREVPGDGTASPNTDFRCHHYEIKDGQTTPVEFLDDQGREIRSGGDVSQFHPAYDQTLFCIEAPGKQDGPLVTDNRADLMRVPLVRGMLTPSNEPVIEFFSDGSGSTGGGGANHPTGSQVGRYLRLTGTTPLVAGTTYTLTFRKKSLFEVLTAPILPIGFRMEIWIDGAVDVGKDYVFNTVATIPHTDTHGFHRACAHRPEYDINIGASHVNDYEDKSELAPIDNTGGSFPRPLPVRHGMLRNRCYQDHPGFFQMGFFRMWAGVGISDEDIAQTWNTSIVNSRSSDTNLIINIEIDHVAPQILNKTRYVLPFVLNYKSWHVHNGDHSFSPGKWQWEEFTWENEDCLGYNRLPSDYLPSTSQQSPCNLLGLYNAVLARTYGLFSIFGDSPFFDNDLSGNRKDVYVPVVGLLNEFVPNQKWESTSIADRMVLTAAGALPKIFDGKSVYTMGFTMYRGPYPKFSGTRTGGTYRDNKFFGIRIAYFAEKDAILAISPLTVLRTERIQVAVTEAVVAGGATYLATDVVTVVGGTGTAATITIDTVDGGGGVLTASILTGGEYSILPVNPVSVTGGAGTGATFTLTYSDQDQDTNKLTLSDIIPHPDPRVTSFRIYRTVAQDTRVEAEVAPVFLLPDGAFENKFTLEVDIIGLDSALLDTILDLNVTTPPSGSISGALDGILWIGGDPLIGDAIYPSDPGNPQRFDIIAGQRVIEEDSGELVNSILPLFGSLFVSKPTSIHRLDPQGNNQFLVQKVVGVGPVSARAIEVVVLPQDGRTVIVFWSRFGPYLFDGAKDQYLGQFIEINRAGGKPYDWLDAASVFILHDPTNRELQFRYKSVTAGVTADRHDKALVYNYRLNHWYHYGQTIGDYALSANIANDGSIAAITAGTPTVSPIPLTPTETRKLIVGGPNGHLYEWGSDARDGERTEVSTNPGTILSWLTPTITLDASIFSASNVVRGNWVTVYKADGSDWFSLPALTNTADTLSLDLAYGAVKFAPVATDLVYVGQPVAHLEFPWDHLDRPGMGKEINIFLLWFNKAVYYKFAKDWDTANTIGWVLMADKVGKRFTEALVSQGMEASKLYLHSVELESRIDQLVYLVNDLDGVGLDQ